jgi:hypothetical protein
VRTSIATPYTDSRAVDLSLAYGLAPLPALGVHPVRLPGLELELRVLGASHQVLLLGPTGVVSETVACLPERSGALPAQENGVEEDFAVRFESGVRRLSPDDMVQRVGEIVRRCTDDEQALVGEFPGSPLAVTALLARAEPDGGVRWWTWHAYPQAGELVETASVVSPR